MSVPDPLDEPPVLVTTGEAATLCKTSPAAIRVRVHRDQLHPAGQTTRGHLLFWLTDIFATPTNQRLRDKDAHAV